MLFDPLGTQCYIVSFSKTNVNSLLQVTALAGAQLKMQLVHMVQLVQRKQTFFKATHLVSGESGQDPKPPASRPLLLALP